MKNRELRLWSADIEVRASPGGGVTLTGYAAVFNRYSQDLGGFVERVLPGAFTKTIQESDIRALVNHDSNRLLGRNKSETLRLSEDTLGLHYEVDLPDTQDARDVRELAARGDLTGSSFSFRVIETDWGWTEQDYPLRDLIQVRLFDVGPVTYPAYLSTEEADTSVAVRSLSEKLSVPTEKVIEAIEARSLSSLIRNPEAVVVLEPEQPSTRSDADALALARMRLELASVDDGAA